MVTITALNRYAIRVNTESAELIDFIEQHGIMPNAIPQFKILSTGVDNPDWIFNYESNKDKPNFQVNPSDKTMYCQGEYDRDVFGWDLVHLAELGFEYSYQTDGLVSFHSAAVSKDNKAVLILGTHMSGKSTLATYMCLNQGYALLSGERTVVDLDMQILGGTETLALRPATIDTYFPGLRNNKKRVYLPEELKIEKGQSAYIEKIVIPQQRAKNNLFPLNKGMQRLYLYGNMSETINGLNLLSHQRIPMPSLDTLEFRKQRAQLTQKLSKLEMILIEGSLNFISESIDNLLQE